MSSTPEAPAARKTVLTCAQPTGKLHLGNYLGAVRHWTTFLGANDCFFGIVDMHAITVPHVPADLRRNSLDCAAQYIACGLDPAKCSIFLQSHVVGHAELAWVLGCLCPLGQLQRMTQFKDKSGKEGATVGSGLLTYPVLMAADILLYQADLVPVGEDQVQHLELTRDLAAKFNNTYSPTFTLPEYVLGKAAARVMSLQEPTRKMSKSDTNQNANIYITDDADTIRRKIGRAVTDSGTEIRPGDDKPGITNLLDILAAATGKTMEQLTNEWAGKTYGEFKPAVGEAVAEMLAPVREKHADLSKHPDHLASVLKAGAEQAQHRAYRTLAKVYKKTGFVERFR